MESGSSMGSTYPIFQHIVSYWTESGYLILGHYKVRDTKAEFLKEVCENFSIKGGWVPP